MLLIPDPTTARIDRMCEIPTLSLICDINDPLTKQPYSRDPRYVARKAEEYLKSTGIADTAYFGPELEFFIFDDVRFDQTANSGYYYVDSVEGEWNTGKERRPQPRLQAALQGRLLPRSRPTTPSRTSAAR